MYSRVSTFFCLLLLIAASSVSYAYEWLDGPYIPEELHVGKLIIIEGCRGEFCTRFCDETIQIGIPHPDWVPTSHWFQIFENDRFSGWYESEKPIGLKTSSPFTLYSDLDGPTPTTRYGAGVIVKPLEQKIVIRDRGEYVIEEIMNTDTPLKVGDKIDTPIYAGEGFIMVRSNGRWIEFDGPVGDDDCFGVGNCNDLKLNVIREAEVEYWIKVEVEGVVGFT